MGSTADTSQPGRGGSIPAYRYSAALAATIEQRWQDHWDQNHTFEAPNTAGPIADVAAVAGREKLFILDMFPYPSGAGLHVGHPLGYIATDVFGRYKRMTGKNVLHSIGYDSFGLPAEQHAIVTGIHPRINTESNIANMRRQLRRLGLAHDQRRSVSTTDESYYRWTQWIFLQIFNSWYDEKLKKARHINELEKEFADSKRSLPLEHFSKKWAQLSKLEQRKVLDEYR
ncbi:MAG: leucine--tRNA ligase, partial [Actinobacteria bacterium]|nr:leucine--tRNA ligase [Actinomycetota bacterium]